jgi:outer membrane protein OmpA-like peptidoglycan-associated protein
MKKVSLLAIALIVGLPGCGNKQNKVQETNKKARVEKHVDMFSSVEMADVFEPDYLDEDGDDLRTFFDFDEEAEEFIPAEEGDLYRNFDIEGDLSDTQDYAWVDAQADDELKTLYFAFNHYGINEDQKKVVEHDIEQLKSLLADSDIDAQPVVVVEGHACQEGSPAYNLALSEKRAKNVADLLVAAGIDKDTIKVVGRGQEVPAVINGKVVDGSREDRAPNRRVELRVIYT